MHLKRHPLVQAMALAMLLAPVPMSAWAETSGETHRNEAEQEALGQSANKISASTTPANIAPANTNANINTLPTIVISAHPLDRTAADIATPVSVVEHDQLASGATTLGQALAGQPGIYADSFGGGASRPVIRGQTAPRVKVLSDGSEVMDASAISPDHMVTVEPLLSEKIEVLRGPSTLLYGSGAIGGAINVLDNKIPTRMPENGLEGEVNLRGNTVADEKAAAAAVTVGLGEQFALHVEGVKRDANDYKVRGYAPEGENEKRVDGSYATGENASVGLSWIGERGFAGLAFTQRKDEYGLPGHSHEYESCHPHGTHLHCGGHDEGHEGEDEAAHDHDDGHEHDHDHNHETAPWIELDSKRVDFRAEYAQPFTGFDKIRVRAGYTDYQHDEVEEGSVATQFNNKGYDGRIELTHVPVAGFEGVLGLQYARSDFEANGEEAFLPKTLTENISAFLLEHYQWNDVHFELGARQEWQTINPELGLAKFSTKDYDDTATSASFAATWEFVPDYALALSLAHSERMPNTQELYANGGHFATNTYELGDANLSNEKSNNVELSLRKTSGDFTFGLSAYHNQVDDYIYAKTLDRFEDFRLIQYTQADATFNGVEAESSYCIDDNYTATLFGDYVRAKLDSSDLKGNSNLPRIPAARLGSRIQANWDALGGQLGGALEYAHVFKQNDIADYESTTAGYNLINATLAYDGELNARNSYRLYLQMNNLLDEKYYSHSSFLSTIPQPGRNFTAGIQLKF
ncbi:TonB-dependent receptor domain-containing protein [Alkanindiges illinoisensis]|uniref:TonB-dependent receptor domain-containing protein n=1 Tax=Alkanindiges illinoisensis TaxID=197183 RepID=UPI00068508BC|nr:TonB-dependent receptor [Alkanindiges illinoisensis]